MNITKVIDIIGRLYLYREGTSNYPSKQEVEEAIIFLKELNEH